MAGSQAESFAALACRPYSKRPRQRHPGQCSAEAEKIVAENVGQHQPPLTALEKGHAFEGVAGECRERTAEADHHQQPPSWIDENALRRPNHEKAYDKAAQDVDDQRAVGKNGPQLPDCETAQDIPQIRAQDGGDRDSEKVFHSEYSYKNGFQFCRSYQPTASRQLRRLWRTPSPLIIFYH